MEWPSVADYDSLWEIDQMEFDASPHPYERLYTAFADDVMRRDALGAAVESVADRWQRNRWVSVCCFSETAPTLPAIRTLMSTLATEVVWHGRGFLGLRPKADGTIGMLSPLITKSIFRRDGSWHQKAFRSARYPGDPDRTTSVLQPGSIFEITLPDEMSRRLQEFRHECIVLFHAGLDKESRIEDFERSNSSDLVNRALAEALWTGLVLAAAEGIGWVGQLEIACTDYQRARLNTRFRAFQGEFWLALTDGVTSALGSIGRIRDQAG